MAATTKERLDKHDREIAAIRKLIVQGMGLLVDFQRENRKAQSEVRQEIKSLATAQKRTEESLKAFIDAGKRGNGHTKNVSLQ